MEFELSPWLVIPILQGKSEQMMDYIKKLRVCIKAFQELDTNHTQEHLNLSKQIEDERHRRLEAGFARRAIFEFAVKNHKSYFHECTQR